MSAYSRSEGRRIINALFRTLPEAAGLLDAVREDAAAARLLTPEVESRP